LNGLFYATYITGPGAQVVYGIDVIDPSLTGDVVAAAHATPRQSAGPLQLLAVGESTSNVFTPDQAQNPNPGYTSAFFLDLQLNPPASLSTLLQDGRAHTK